VHEESQKVNDYYDELLRICDQMNEMVADESCQWRYNVYLNSVVWEDEIKTLCLSESPIVEFLFVYRQSLIHGKPIAEITPYWEFAKQHCPNWPGFSKVRCKSSKDLAQMIDLAKVVATERFLQIKDIECLLKNDQETGKPS
jgi:hypothetical protein